MKNTVKILLILFCFTSCTNQGHLYFYKKPKGITKKELKNVEYFKLDNLNKSNCIEMGKIKHLSDVCFCKNLQHDNSYSIGMYMSYDSTKVNKLESVIDTVGIISKTTSIDITLIPVLKPIGYIYFFDASGNIINYKYYPSK